MQNAAARAFWITSPGRGEIRETLLPPLARGCLRLRSLYSGVSRGSESLVFLGKVPPSLYQSLRAPFQEGDYPAPVCYGYSNVAVVEEGPAPWPGQLVFSLTPHRDRFDLPIEAARPLPETLPPGRGVLAANMETALNALWDCGAVTGKRVAVLGAGVVGCLFAWLAAREKPAGLVLADIDDGKAEIAARLSVSFERPEALSDDFDLVVHASGNPDGLITALGLAGFEATILELSWFGASLVTLPLGEAFHARRLTLKASQVGSVSASRRATWSHAQRLEEALRLLCAPNLEALINSESTFDDLPSVMPRLAAGPAGLLCHRVVYETKTA